MHSYIEHLRKILDIPGALLAGVAVTLTLSHIEAFMTIFAATVSAVCGLVRLYDWYFRNRPIGGD